MHMADTNTPGTPSQKHICLFYGSIRDLLDMVSFYLREGLRKNELCVWIVPEFVGLVAAGVALRNAIKDFDLYLEKKQVRLLDQKEYYEKSSLENALDNWVRMTQEALDLGFEGLCVSGDGTSVKWSGWDALLDYENKVEAMLRDLKMRALCTYALDEMAADEMMSLSKCHDLAVSQRDNKMQKLPR
jgi:hypothetical protein